MARRIALLGVFLILAGSYSATSQETPENFLQGYGMVVEPLKHQEGISSALCVINMSAGEDPLWFLLNPLGNTQIAAVPAAFHLISDIKASPDGKYLAVLSVGEGHPIVEVIDFPALLTQKTYTVLHTINPYPGSIDLRSWTEATLHMGSDMLLTYQDQASGEIPPEFMLAEPEIFGLNMITLKISGISEGAKNPVGHYAKILKNPQASEAQKDKALSLLIHLDAADVSMGDLVMMLEQEQDAKRILKLLEQIENIRQKQDGTPEIDAQ